MRFNRNEIKSENLPIVKDRTDRVISWLKYCDCDTYIFEEANSARSMMEILQRKKFDCIILDYLLIDSTGVKVLEILKEKKIDTKQERL